MIQIVIDFILKWLDGFRVRQALRKEGSDQAISIANKKAEVLEAAITQAVNEAPKSREEAVEALRKGAF